MARRKKEIKEEMESDFEAPFKLLKQETVEAIWAIVLIVVALFLLLASIKYNLNQENAGVATAKIYEFFSYLLGIGYYLLPLICMMLGISFLRSLRHNFATRKIIGSLFFFLAGLGMLSLISPGIYSETVIEHGRGGLIGDLISRPLVTLFAPESTFIFLLALITISCLVIFDTPLRIPFKNLFRRKGKEGEIEEQEKVIKLSEPEMAKIEKKIEEQFPEDEEPVKEVKPIAAKESKPKVEEKTDTGFFMFPKKNPNMGAFTPPPLSLLENDKGKPGVGDIKANANIIKRTLQNFGIVVEMDEISIGPSVTRYALKPAEGVKLSKIVTLQNDLSLALAAHPIRIEAPIPGKSLVGIEIPNTTKTTVGLGTLLGSQDFQGSDKPLMVGLGKGISGKAHFANVAKMPHLLIAGATGSGKSVTIHTLITSLLYRNSPENLKFIMIDPKRVELTLYNKIPHLLTPVITDAKKAILALRWAAKEMDRRYDILQNNSVRDIQSYHKNVLEPAVKDGVEEDAEAPETMPYIVIIIDELADIMQTYPRELEAAIVRLAQMSRAVGIHLMLSTQRPSVNVITGLIKANIPARLALQVASQIDSRTILDMPGAEKLLGQGDMLYLSGEMSQPTRIQSAFISENEVKKVVKYLIDTYKDEIPSPELDLGGNANAEKNFLAESLTDGGDDDEDELYEEARETVIQAGKASTSYLQRKLRIGYARAARLMDILEERGVIAPGDGAKPREVLQGRSEAEPAETE